MALRDEEEDGCKVGITEQRLNAFKHIAKEHLKCLITHNNLLALKARACVREFLVNEFIQLAMILI